MALPAFVYARFSTQEQSRGFSLQRQLEEGKAFAERNGWDWSPAREFRDEGRSAYHGSNRLAGSALHAFEEEVREGRLKSGAVLIVENLDRLSRQGYDETIDLLRLMTRNGVTVATWQDNQLYEADRRIDVGNVMALIIKAELAFQESDKKSKRLTDAWKRKIERAREGDRRAMTKVVPGWLELDEQRNIREIGPRVQVLNEIFDLYLAGRGLPQIARLLNERREPNWGRGKHADRGWNVATLHKYLTSRTVLGEYEPKRRTEVGVAKIGKGFVIPDYYPQVISPDKFNQVQVVRRQRTHWGGKNQQSLPNLFSGIATCGDCGGPLHMVAQTKVGRTRISKHRDGSPRPYTEVAPRSYLRCNNAIRGYGCENKSGIRYETLERGVLDVLWAQAAKRTTYTPESRVGQLTARMAEQERLIQIKRDELDQVIANLGQFVSRALAERAAALENEIDEDKDDLRVTKRDLDAELASKPAEQDFEELLASRDLLASDDDEQRYEARSRAHRNLRALITRMECGSTGDIFVVVGRNAIAWHFNRAGECQGAELGQGAIYEGPDGQPDWHPDDEDRGDD